MMIPDRSVLGDAATRGGCAPGPVERSFVMDVIDPERMHPKLAERRRNQAEARRVANLAYPFRCCVICGLQIPTCLQIAHLDHDAGNNSSENLSRFCPTHHWMYDSGFYPIEAVRLLQLQLHWQEKRGAPDHEPRMKDAGAKAALNRKRSAAERKAAATRRGRGASLG